MQNYKKDNRSDKIQTVKTYYITDLDQCEKLWKKLITPKHISDLWEFRLCFHNHFQHKPFFFVLEDQKGISGMIPMSHVENIDTCFLFPGEMWNNKTWLERTPVYIRDGCSINKLLNTCPDNVYLRYLEVPYEKLPSGFSEDETGYVLYPGNMGFNIDEYFKRFSHKKIKAIHKVIHSYLDSGCEFFYDRVEDFDSLVEMSLQQFGNKSFLYDERFRNGFRDALDFLQKRKMLRITSVVIDGELAATDIGAVFQGIYTVFMGGTDSRFPGIAKLMNMGHIDYAFRERINKVDFLCGGFHWKLLWHLDPEILYEYKTNPLSIANIAGISHSSTHMSAVK